LSSFVGLLRGPGSSSRCWRSISPAPRRLWPGRDARATTATRSHDAWPPRPRKVRRRTSGTPPTAMLDDQPPPSHRLNRSSATRRDSPWKEQPRKPLAQWAFRPAPTTPGLLRWRPPYSWITSC